MTSPRNASPLLLALAVAGGAAAQPIAGSHAASPAARPLAHVAIQGFAFRPAVLRIKAGTTVSWTNKDTMAHNVTAANGRWHSATLNQGQSYTYTFKKAGTFAYSCTFHPGMSAKVIVTK